MGLVREDSFRSWLVFFELWLNNFYFTLQFSIGLSWSANACTSQICSMEKIFVLFLFSMSCTMHIKFYFHKKKIWFKLLASSFFYLTTKILLPCQELMSELTCQEGNTQSLWCCEWCYKILYWQSEIKINCIFLRKPIIHRCEGRDD